MNIKSFVAAAAIVVASTTAGSAVTVEVSGVTYDVSYITTSYSASSAILEDQIWWGEYRIGNAFSKAVKAQLGSPNFSGTGGALFADQIYSGKVFSEYYKTLESTNARSATGLGSTYAYAVATVAAVPVPAAGLLLFAALGPLAALKRRTKHRTKRPA